MKMYHQKRWDDEDVKNEPQKTGNMKMQKESQNRGKVICALFRTESWSAGLSSMPLLGGCAGADTSQGLKAIQDHLAT